MGLIHYDKVVLRKIVHKRIGHGSRGIPVHMPGIILYSRAEARFPEHLYIISGPLAYPLRL